MQSYLPKNNKASNHFTNSSHFNSFNQGPNIAGIGQPKWGAYGPESPEDDSNEMTLGGMQAIKSLGRQ
jgi:hypothetical protein